MAYETVKSWKEEKLKSIIWDNIFLFFCETFRNLEIDFSINLNTLNDELSA